MAGSTAARTASAASWKRRSSSAFCLELKRQLEATRRYKVLMTREGDQYVDLDEPRAFARDANASLFISIHADTLTDVGEVSGSTVYTVADRASDAEAARIAARENAASRTPGKARTAHADPGVARHPVRPQAPRNPRSTPISFLARWSTTCAARPGSITIPSARRALSS